jgi:AraC-like DNA-binding protein
MITIIIITGILAQTAIALYTFNILRLKNGFEQLLNILLVILFFHLGTKLFILIALKDSFLYNHNATGFGLSYGPLIYLTTLILLRRRPSIRGIGGHMLPFAVFTLLYFAGSACYLFHILPADFISGYAQWYHWLVISSLFIYPLAALRLLYKAISFGGQPSESGEDQPSGPAARLLKQMACIMLGGVILGLTITANRIWRTGLYDFDLRLIPYICFTPLPFLILHYKIRTDQVPDADAPGKEIPSDKPDPSKEKQYKKSALDDQMMHQYELTLKQFMEKSKIYLEAGISLEMLSEKCKIPKHHLTQVLNERFEKNFYTFVNEYRIAEAIARLKNPDIEVSILSLAYDCGFNSKSSFNSYFKKVTHLTPSAYRKVQVPELLGEDQLAS